MNKTDHEIKDAAETWYTETGWIDADRNSFAAGAKWMQSQSSPSPSGKEEGLWRYSKEQLESYGKQILKSISDTFLKPENLSKASFNDQAVIQAVGETILNFPLPDTPASPAQELGYTREQIFEACKLVWEHKDRIYGFDSDKQNMDYFFINTVIPEIKTNFLNTLNSK